MTDHKKLYAIIQRLADELQVYINHAPIGFCGPEQAVVDEARNLLAQQEPEGPTDEEIMELMPQQMRDDFAAAARALSSFDLNYIKAASTFRIILNRHVVNHARAVLTKWSYQ